MWPLIAILLLSISFHGVRGGGSVVQPIQDAPTSVSANSTLDTTAQNTTTQDWSIPLSWTMTGNSMQLFESTHVCTMLTSPAVGGVYQGSTSMAIRWLYDNDGIQKFRTELNRAVDMSIDLWWVDNQTNQTGQIASGVDPLSGVYLWDIPSQLSSTFNKRLYVVLQPSWTGLTAEEASDTSTFEQDNGLDCISHPQVAGPFTMLPQSRPLFFVTGPDPGTSQQEGTGLLANLPLGRLFIDMALPITWYCTLPNIATIDILLVPTDQQNASDTVTIGKNLNVYTARYYYSVPQSNTFSMERSYRIMLYGYTVNFTQSPFVTWAAEGPYRITDPYGLTAL
ncbi:hypothetical protein J3Q64DRAFT_1455034 [Phycomyces blakesleeanus]|uniref:Uncharacterized protein n=2 Tax=Phycomyces blakesleeanus TaxID=4837 RepID=A0A167L569_PHYB8|nr:hypothetical protein PHYBLDRAFT_66162 [Phycomyces blakesleeanus NRRL 1555(-)]OAD69617.1 hypothetical protein PHYBLDRAFT_66162 [Phycomyces blakesleeanus NRRL 1555(-)]|eukprot:XP_018287657.1 hypothetical protein PHYBLDRAFT_66162 [Phycomyces blakesleeanus NRRL 1555(-)]